MKGMEHFHQCLIDKLDTDGIGLCKKKLPNPTRDRGFSFSPPEATATALVGIHANQTELDGLHCQNPCYMYC